MKKILSILFCIILLAGCSFGKGNKEEKAFVSEKVDANTLVYKNTDSIKILEVDADLSSINDNLSIIRTSVEDEEFNSTLKIEDGKIVFEVNNAKELNFETDTVKYIITAIKNPTTIYFYPGISAEDSMPVEFYVKNAIDKVYLVKFTAKMFDGYSISELKEKNAGDITKYVIQDGSVEVDLPYGSGIDSESKFKELYKKEVVQCGYRGMSTDCEFKGKDSVIAFVQNGEAYEAYANYIECDASIATNPEKCVNSEEEYYSINGLTGLNNVTDVNMDIDSNMYRVIYIATEDGKLYYYIRSKSNPEKYSLIRVNTSLSFIEFERNIEAKKINGTKTVFMMSDGNTYYINYNSYFKTISLEKYD